MMLCLCKYYNVNISTKVNWHSYSLIFLLTQCFGQVIIMLLLLTRNYLTCLHQVRYDNNIIGRISCTDQKPRRLCVLGHWHQNKTTTRAFLIIENNLPWGFPLKPEDVDDHPLPVLVQHTTIIVQKAKLGGAGSLGISSPGCIQPKDRFIYVCRTQRSLECYFFRCSS